MSYELYAELLNEVLRRHPEVVDCQAHRAIIAEFADDGVTFDADSWERVLLDLIQRGAILTRPTADMIAEERYQREKTARKIASDLRDDIRRLKRLAIDDPEAYIHEMRRRRLAEEKLKREASAAANKALTDMTPAELRAKIRAEDLVKRPWLKDAEVRK